MLRSSSATAPSRPKNLCGTCPSTLPNAFWAPSALREARLPLNASPNDASCFEDSDYEHALPHCRRVERWLPAHWCTRRMLSTRRIAQPARCSEPALTMSAGRRREPARLPTDRAVMPRLSDARPAGAAQPWPATGSRWHHVHSLHASASFHVPLGQAETTCPQGKRQVNAGRRTPCDVRKTNRAASLPRGHKSPPLVWQPWRAGRLEAGRRPGGGSQTAAGSQFCRGDARARDSPS